ncbi:unnamed protein product [Taenia asiatica]|uniref:Uncharacterized protein n=1 Tax=Taenia asiatica TaxID=60517 RepID=A0A3P6NNG8_TAEAS|nr:unnamed protein product [Taenia asiatica]
MSFENESTVSDKKLIKKLGCKFPEQDCYLGNFRLLLLLDGTIRLSVTAHTKAFLVLSFQELFEADAFDDDLLLLGLVAEEHKKAGAMFVGKVILEMAQALLQVFLILEPSRREAGETVNTISKPG